METCSTLWLQRGRQVQRLHGDERDRVERRHRTVDVPRRPSRLRFRRRRRRLWMYPWIYPRIYTVDVPGAHQDLLHAQRQVLPVRLAALRHPVYLVDAQRPTARHLLQRHDEYGRLLRLGQSGQSGDVAD